MAILFRPDPLEQVLALGLQYHVRSFTFQSGGTTSATILPPRAGRVGALFSYTRGSQFPVFRNLAGQALPLAVGSDTGWVVVSSAQYPWLLDGVVMADAPSGVHTLTVLDQWVVV